MKYITSMFVPIANGINNVGSIVYEDLNIWGHRFKVYKALPTAILR